jgi:hypothetical protein
MHNDPKYHNSDKTLFEYIRYDFDIKDDELRKYLKEKKIHYSQEEFAEFSPLSEGDAPVETQPDEYNKETNTMDMDFAIFFDKIQISNKEQSTFLYKIEIK